MKQRKIIIGIVAVVIIIIIIISALLVLVSSQKNNSNKNNTNKEESHIADLKSNQFTYDKVSDKTMATLYLYNYRDTALRDTKQAYKLLNKEYKEKKFPTLESYQQYMKEQEDTLNTLQLSSYEIKKTDQYTQYICMDSNTNFYIIREYSVMKYDIMLDKYTVEDKEVQQDYTKQNVQTKVMYNINKFIGMINNKDYEGSYAVLAQGFKNNYFPTSEAYKNYITTNFYNSNHVEFLKMSYEGNVNMYLVRVTNKEGSGGQSFEKTFFVQLTEGSDFQLSFNVQ